MRSARGRKGGRRRRGGGSVAGAGSEPRGGCGAGGESRGGGAATGAGVTVRPARETSHAGAADAGGELRGSTRWRGRGRRRRRRRAPPPPPLAVRNPGSGGARSGQGGGGRRGFGSGGRSFSTAAPTDGGSSGEHWRRKRRCSNISRVSWMRARRIGRKPTLPI
ncbi:hypothetical protein ACP70R_000068 [Stipagrostis hirtigluma subsp. patula]